jgi:putative addiction module CopG family antidote
MIGKRRPRFVERLVSGGRYRTASEVVRQGLRLLEETEHRRLLEDWILEGLTEEEQEGISPELLDTARAHFRKLVDAALTEVAEDGVVDGPTAMQRLKERIEARVGAGEATSPEGGPGINRYHAYDPFARVYDQHWGFFATKAYPILEHLVLESLPPGCAVLDLCCGTGQLAAELSRQGYRTTGLDASEGMIEIARKNAPDADFVVQDARGIALPRRFSAVFSTFDSLNHVLSLDELEQVFQRVFAVLEGGGYFVFDLNMEVGFRSRWRGSFEFVDDDHVCVVRSSHDANEKTGRLDVTLLERKGSDWVRTDFPLVQRWYGEREIRERLRRAGFEELQSFDENEPILEGSLHEGRMFFVAKEGRTPLNPAANGTPTSSRARSPSPTASPIRCRRRS